jgi:hypothetical protein
MAKLEVTASALSPTFLVYEPHAEGVAEERLQRWLRGTEYLAALSTG